jgi:tryptophan-rich sensory protein
MQPIKLIFDIMWFQVYMKSTISEVIELNFDEHQRIQVDYIMFDYLV